MRRRAAASLVAALAAVTFTLGVYAQSNPPLNRTLNERIEFIPGANGVALETTLFKPAGDGPFPLVIINHGKAPGDARQQPRARYIVAASEFVRRGYAVAVPMRAGFSNSSGVYDSQGCDLEGNGLTQAASVRAALHWLREQSFVDPTRIVVIGQSHGGLATTALGTQSQDGILALINFAGGLRQRNCPDWEEQLARAFAAYGRTNRYRMLWFYGDNDSYFSLDRARDMHARFVKNGGRAELIAFGAFKADAHRLFADRDGLSIWWPIVERLLKDLRLPTEMVTRTLENTDPAMAALLDMQRIPHVSAACRRLYEQFLYLDLPRAYAISADGRCGYASGGENPQQRALGFCQRKAAQACRLYAVDEKVVWN
jgi:dienelactone hydrolase